MHKMLLLYLLNEALKHQNATQKPKVSGSCLWVAKNKFMPCTCREYTTTLYLVSLFIMQAYHFFDSEYVARIDIQTNISNIKGTTNSMYTKD